MKIIHITAFSINNWNGIAEIVQNISEKQSNLGHEIEIINLYQTKNLSHYKKIPVYNFLTLKEFQNHIKNFNPEIVIFHALYHFRYIDYYKFFKKNSIPYLILAHGAFSKESHKKRWLKKRIAQILYFKKFAENANAIIYNNTNELENSILKNKIEYTIIPNGVNAPKSFHPNINNNPIKLIYLSRIDVNHKGLDILLDALKLVENQIQNVTINLYGTGEKKSLSIVKSKLKSIKLDIVLNQPIYGTDKNDVLNNSDIFLLTSRYEGMPMAILEALSFGVPCFITKETNCADIIIKNKCGWVTPCNITEVSKNLIKAIEDYSHNKEAYRINSRNAISEGYSWEHVALKSIIFYQKVINYKTDSQH